VCVNKNVRLIIENRFYHRNCYCVTQDIIATCQLNHYFQRYEADKGGKMDVYVYDNITPKNYNYGKRHLMLLFIRIIVTCQ